MGSTPSSRSWRMSSRSTTPPPTRSEPCHVVELLAELVGEGLLVVGLARHADLAGSLGVFSS